MKQNQSNPSTSKDVAIRLPSLSRKQLNDLPSLDRYLYNNWRIQDIISAYIQDLKAFGKKENNRLELYHAQFLERYLGIVNNDLFMDSIQDDFEKKFMNEVSSNHPDFCFALRGRLKSLFRVENKFNAYIQDFIIDYISKHGKNPSISMIIKYMNRFCDIIAYRFILQDKSSSSNSENEIKHLIDIANKIPDFFDANSLSKSSVGGYTLLKAFDVKDVVSHNESLLAPNVRPFYKDYVSNIKNSGFSALTITMLHIMSQQRIELQLMTFDMNYNNEHNVLSIHGNYEENQKMAQLEAELPNPHKFNKIFLQAHERLHRLHGVKFPDIKVKLFKASEENGLDDFCGLVIGRQVKPVEYL